MTLRSRTAILLLATAAALCLLGCVSAEKNEYRAHLSLSVPQGGVDDGTALMFLGWGNQTTSGPVTIANFKSSP